MKFTKIYRIHGYTVFLLMVSLFYLTPSLSHAQQNPTADELYKQARDAAFENDDYDSARKLAYQALKISPNYHGIRIFVARLYSWKENYEKARTELNYVLNEDPDNRRALSARVDVENWSGNVDAALNWTNKALEYYPQDEEFMLAKASLLSKKENYEKAEKLYEQIIKIYPSQKARKALEEVQLKQMKYTGSISYRYDRFKSIFDPWHFVDVQLSRQTSYGSIIGSVQYANRFSSNGLQFNLDAYPSFSDGFYAYVSGGYSASSIYPRYRFGLSLYKSLPYAFEIEGGLRYLDFSSSKTTIYTGSLSKYWGSYLFTARTYIVPSSGGTSQSLTLLGRRYFGNAQSYFEISGGFGSASSNIQFAEDIRRLDSWTIGVGGQLPINDRINISASIDYDSEEYPNYERSRFSFRVNLSYRF